jgi:hypothetical protein
LPIFFFVHWSAKRNGTANVMSGVLASVASKSGISPPNYR